MASDKVAARSTDTPTQASESSTNARSGRVISVDALRGFDMFWIAGGHGIVLGIVGLIASPVPELVRYEMSHPAWIGFSAWDLIMPLFLFIVGVAMPFSFSKRIAQGQTKRQLYSKIVRRTIILFVLGMMVQGHLLDFKLETLHIYCNTLQAIAIGYLFASIIMLELPLMLQVGAIFVLLIGYWALLTFVPYPGGAAGMLKPDNNLALYIDKLILGRFEDGLAYTWILSGLGFTATTLLGVMGGKLLRANSTPWAKVLWLTLLGLLCLAAGWVWGFWLPQIAPKSSPLVGKLAFPVIKHIWTSSMVLWAGGWSFLLLAAFYCLIDVIGWKRWASFFIVYGANAIFIYVTWHMINYQNISNPFLGGLAAHIGRYGDLLKNLGAVAVAWGILAYMYRNRTFVRV